MKLEVKLGARRLLLVSVTARHTCCCTCRPLGLRHIETCELSHPRSWCRGLHDKACLAACSTRLSFKRRSPATYWRHGPPQNAGSYRRDRVTAIMIGSCLRAAPVRDHGGARSLHTSFVAYGLVPPSSCRAWLSFLLSLLQRKALSFQPRFPVRGRIPLK